MQLKYIASAVALALIVSAVALADPLQDPAQDVYEAGIWAMAMIEFVNVVQPEPQYEAHNHTWETPGEQLVEGHTTFVVLNAASSENHTELKGNVTVTGMVRCEDTVRGDYKPWLSYTVPSYVPVVGGDAIAVPFPTGASAKVECYVGQQVIITPTVYCHVTGNYGCTTDTQPSLPTMSPTGRIVPFVAPGGAASYMTEYSFEAPAEDGWPMTYYAWSVPLVTPWVNEDGEPQNLFCPIPRDAYDTMGVKDFVPLWADKVPREA